ncbi:MAG: aconitate hydratase [Chloroflexi bacterium]|nr:aconitate hydratase [Chloroflexota bacterium]
MGMNLTQKIISEHLASGRMVPGEEIGISIDQGLTQDATGTMTWLQFEALGFPRVRVKRAIAYIDHNMLQTGFENADDHLYLQSVASKFGAYLSRPGNGISHQVQMERFDVPGQTLLGADSHTCMAGCLGMLAIGAGGLDVAVALGGGPYYLPMPKVTLVRLKGRLSPWVAAKDITLELLRRLTVKGGVGKVMEFGGPGTATLTVPQRATMANLGAELGATTTVFPSDAQARSWLRAQQREQDWKPLTADPDATYDEVIEIDLSTLEPLIARPSSPDNVVPVREMEGTPVVQVCVGSSNNSSYVDLMTVAAVLKGKKVNPGVSLTISPGSRQVLSMVARGGGLLDMVAAGARILEAACGPCIGMGQAPPSGGVSVRTFNRNFPGRSGTADDQVYLASPEVAAATALYGAITDPRRLGEPIHIRSPRSYIIDDSEVLRPSPEPDKVKVLRGPNIKPVPMRGPLSDVLKGRVLIKVGDNITTDHIMPAGNNVLPLRSNIPRISEHVFEQVDPTFPARAREWGGGFIVAGQNYGQGSSREHAALAPMYLGVTAVAAQSFARIHFANLINVGILPLTFAQPQDYRHVQMGDECELSNVRASLRAGRPLLLRNLTQGWECPLNCNLTPRQVDILMAGGLLNHIKAGGR